MWVAWKYCAPRHPPTQKKQIKKNPERFKSHLLVLWVAKLSKWVPGSAPIPNEDVQIPVMAKQKLSSIVIGCRLHHLKDGSGRRHTICNIHLLQTHTTDIRYVSTFAHHPKIKPKYPGHRRCHLVPVIWSLNLSKPRSGGAAVLSSPPCTRLTQSQAGLRCYSWHFV